MIGHHNPGLSRQPGVIHFNANSGAQAINLLTGWGAAEIVLLGFDMGLAPDGRRHFFGDHPAELNKPSPYSDWVRRFDQIAADARDMGVRIINCSRRTALRCFEQQPLEALT